MAKARRARARARDLKTVGPDEALIALFIGAMSANDHVSPQEGARAHHLIWSTRRFRRKSGETVGKLIDRMRTLLEAHEATTVMQVAANAIPARQRPSAFAVVADLLLADGRIDPRERRFLQRLGSDLRIAPDTVNRIVEVMLVKNHL
jgi:tellurite resistance protein